MNRAHKYMLLCLLTAAAFVFGSMAGMDFILQKRENRLLQESGTVEAESPVLAWQEDGGTEGTDKTAENEKNKQLSVEQMEEVVRYRLGAVEEILHDPVTGQIPMEEAIAFGESWLVEMGFAQESKESGVIVSGESDPQILLRSATLGMKKDQGVLRIPMESYYSFWTVRFSNKFMYAVLSINAVTGKVWDAEITLYRDMSHGMSWERLNLFVELAGVQAEPENFVEVNDKGTWVSLALKDCLLYAQMRYYETVVAVSEPVEYDGDETFYSQRIIEYHLMIKED